MGSEHMGKSEPDHIAWRRRLVIAIGSAAGTYSVMGIAGVDRSLTEGLRLAAELAIFAAAAIMGRAAARQFEQGIKTRLTWIFISIGAALFFIADVGYTYPQ